MRHSLLKAALLLALIPFQSIGSVTVSVNGTSHTIPETGETGWGSAVTSWIQAISSSTLQPNSGTFALTAELDFGASFGIKSLYYKSRTSSPAADGQVRLANTDDINWRNTNDTVDQVLTPGSIDGVLSYFGFDILNTQSAQQVVNKSIDGSNNTITGLSNSSIASDAAIARSKIAAGTANFAVVNDSSGALTNVDLLGTSNQITVTKNANDWTLSTPQNLHTAASVTFGLITANANLDVKNGATGAGVLSLYEDSDNGTNKIQIKATGTLTNDTIYELPAADGSNGQKLTTNGVGGLTWSTDSTGEYTDSEPTVTRIEWVRITNVGTPTVAAGSNGGAWVTSITDNGVGNYTLNYSAAANWSSAPVCTGVPNVTFGDGDDGVVVSASNITTTAADIRHCVIDQVQANDNDCTLTDGGAYIVCIGID